MILSVSIISKDGRPLVARQFNHFTRSQLEGHLNAFPKLLSNSSQSYIETETIRYVFQQIGEQLYFILITSKDSNILEDLDVLSLLIELTCNTLETSDSKITEDLVYDKSFELIFAYDECIFDGYYQDVSLNDVDTFLLMESKEEDEYIQNRRQKEEEAAKQLREKMKEFDTKRKEQQKSDRKNKFLSASSLTSQQSTSYTPPDITITQSNDNPSAAQSNAEKPKPARRPANTQKGMSLGKKTTARDRAQQMIKEEGLTVDETTVGAGKRRTASEVVADKTAAPNSVLVKLTEVMNASVSRQGIVGGFAVEGRLTAESNEKGQYGILMKLFGNSDKFKTRPLNQKERRLFADKSQLVFDNKGAESTLLGWRYTSDKPDDVPVSFSCWITDGVDDKNKETSIFTCEVSLNTKTCDHLSIQTIALSINVAHPTEAKVSSKDGEIEIYERDQILRWVITDIDANNGAEIEFTVPRPPKDSQGSSEDKFFPIAVEIQSDSLYFNADITSVAKIDQGGACDFENPVKFEVAKSFSTAEFKLT